MKSETKEKIFDLILTDALMTCWNMEIQALDNYHEYDDYKFSAEFERKNKKTANSIGRSDRIKKCTYIFVKLVVTTAAIMGAVFGGLLTQPAVYAAVQNVIQTVFKNYDKYDFGGDELTVDNFNNNIRLGYFPEGYYLANGEYSRISVSLTYIDHNDNKIMFDYGIADGSSTIYDNEHNSYSKFIVNDIEYHYYESKDNDFYNTLVWYKDGYSFSVLAHLPKEELVKIAKNVK